MGIIRLLFTLLNNPRVIERLADSRPIRRAAQITAFAITKAQIWGKDTSAKILKSDPVLRQGREEAGQRIPRDLGGIVSRLKRMRETFVKEIREGFRDASRQIKK